MTKVKTSSLQKQLAKAKKDRDSANNKVSELEEKLAQQEEASKPKPKWETITTLTGIYKDLGHNPKKDIIKIDGFNKLEHGCVEAVIERIRISKCYNGGELPDFNERWYPWSYVENNGAGLVFNDSSCNVDRANLGSGVCLSFKEEAASDAYFKNFQSTEERATGFVRKK